MLKKNWIAVIGSPRKGKNTENIIDLVIEALKEKNIIVKKFYLNQKQMSLCTDCEFCIENGVCYINDEISEILSEMKKADGIIFGSPSYNYNVSAQMKVLLDRTFSLNDYTDGTWSSRLNSGKKAIVVGVCKGRAKESMGYTVEAMKISIEELGVRVIDTIEYYDTKNIPVAENPKVRGEILKRIGCNELI